MSVLLYPEPESVTQVMRWRTLIRKKLSGLETRAALQTKPRMSLRYNYLVEDLETGRLQADLFNETATGSWRAPLWWDSHATTDEATASGNTVDGDFSGSDLAQDQWVYIHADDGSIGEFQQVDSLTSTTMTIQGAWGATYAAGSRVVPCRLCQVATDGQGGAHYPINASEFTLELVAEDFYTLGGAGATLTTYQGLNVLEWEPRAGGQPSTSFDRALKFFDGGVVPDVDSYRELADVMRPRKYLAKNRARRQWWKKFLDAQLGSCVPFWAPTWTSDLVLDAQPGPSATILVVDISQTNVKTEWFDVSEGHRDLMIDTDTDGPVYRRATAASDNGDDTMDVTIDSALPSTSGLQVNLVSFLERVRIDDDQVKAVHTGHQTEYSLALRTCRESTPTSF